MLFADYLTIIRGGGDLATGVAYRLHKAGFPLIVTELPEPLVVRRTVSLASAVLQGETTVEDLQARHVESAAEALALALDAESPIPVLTAPDLQPLIANLQSLISQSPVSQSPNLQIATVVDARMAKRNIDTHPEQAPLVIALGPGFTASADDVDADCHAVIETMRGHTLGRVIWHGSALPNTGSPGIVAGKGKERVLRAPATGTVRWSVDIGELVRENQQLGDVDGLDVRAPFYGIVRGLIAPGTRVTHRLKIGDVDARADAQACYTISEKALAIGGGVLEAMLTHLNRATR